MEATTFRAWADGEGYDTAHNYDTERSRWVFFNPMTADLWKCWQAARARSANGSLTYERAPRSRDHRALPDELTHYPPTVNTVGPTAPHLAALVLRLNELWNERASEDRIADQLGMCRVIAEHIARLAAPGG